MPMLPPSLRPSWIALGWFIAASLTALALLALAGLGILDEDPTAEGIWIALALLFGFGAAGFVVGQRTGAAPVLHGLGIGLFTLLVWVAVNLLFGEPTDQTAWTTLDTRAAAGLLVLQATASVVGARIGARMAAPSR